MCRTGHARHIADPAEVRYLSGDGIPRLVRLAGPLGEAGEEGLEEVGVGHGGNLEALSYRAFQLD